MGWQRRLGGGGPVRGPSLEAPARPARPPHVAAALALQRVAGNAAATRVLQRSPQAQVQTPAGTSRARFETVMSSRFGVGTVRAGTEADQLADMRRTTPSADPAPASIGGWQAWDPPATSALYDDILAGFEAMARVLGGTPVVGEMRFLDADYENAAGTAQRAPDHGAFYSAGLLTVFRRIETAGWPLPTAATTADVHAPLTTDGSSVSRRRIIIHELAHGVAERFATPGQPGAEQDFFAKWRQAGGWSGNQIVQNGTALTSSNWNDVWPEQPVSRYSLANPGEDFAESLMAYIERPDMLRARSPGRFAFIDSRKSGWASGLRAPGAPTP